MKEKSKLIYYPVKKPNMREVVLDTETTGLNNNGNVCEGHRVIEIGCVELIDRKPTGREFHAYLNPARSVDPKAVKIHGLTNEFLSDKPLFKDIADDFLKFVNGSTVIIHNAPFDLSFLDQELQLIGKDPFMVRLSSVVDTLKIARDLLPGIKHTLDALAYFFGVDVDRKKHGALLDARILGEVYVAMMKIIMKFGTSQFKDIKLNLISQEE